MKRTKRIMINFSEAELEIIDKAVRLPIPLTQKVHYWVRSKICDESKGHCISKEVEDELFKIQRYLRRKKSTAEGEYIFI